MKLVFIKGSKLVSPPFKQAAADYLARLQAFFPTSEIILKSPDQPLNPSDLQRAIHRGGEPASSFVICLDDKGHTHTTGQLANKLAGIIDNPQWKRLVFVVGSPFGFDQSAKQLANDQWSLARGTYPGDLAWVMTLEQVYRALTVVKGVPYHHE